ncbi:MAG: Gfo/Idh/MocA family oxidoreductase [Desulfobulbaceae bacterium]|nr:Gfo/Idh/MocA family oxidoreductase [Desulfobulbaceae bacterium]
MNSGINKIVRFIKIYGLLRTVVKVAGRLRLPIPLWLLLCLAKPIKNGPTVGIIGCGQFSFSTIAYYLTTSTSCKLKWCSDINLDAARTLAVAFGIKTFSEKCQVHSVPTDLVYIASNHATHTTYAIECLNAGSDVYIEKPISTTWEQLNELLNVAKVTKRKIYVGYNRPHSPAIKMIRKYVSDHDMPFTLSCFITGHNIPENHWYRNPEEGTRVCGNLGHWLDLAVHMACWAGPDISFVDITISYSDPGTPSDNFCVTINTLRGDLVTLTFSSRSEPFEGVNESINFQQGNLIAKVNDHRITQIWVGDKYISKRHWPKNVGHKKAIMQPFDSANAREWSELVISTKIMLFVTDMVNNLETSKRCELSR